MSSVRTDAVLQKTPLSFDVSVWELFWPLLAGAKLVLARAEGHKDPAYLARVIQEHQITTVLFVPSLLGVFVDEPSAAGCSSLRQVLCSGEALSGTLVRRVQECLPHAAVSNIYGPTEAAVDVTSWSCGGAGDGEEELESVPIGRPMANTRLYIVDAHGEPVPIGVAGELWVGGVQVARGYLDRPELTAERFIASPFVAGDRLYKTGDLARYRADGDVEFLGRNDFQVKIRGFRIELGEIEARLREHESIREAVVVAREDVAGEQRLVAYYTARAGAAVSVEELRAHLSASLPDYMVPAAYVGVAAWPLTTSGKLDRKALPAPDGSAYVARAYEAPLGAVEEALARIWCDVLEVERVGRHDNFFELGGHSLLAVRVLSRIRQALEVELSLTQVFALPVLRLLAEAIAALPRRALSAIEPVDRSQRLPLSFAQQRLWFLAQLGGVSQAYHIPLGLRLRGALDRPALRRALDGLVARHEALRTTFSSIDGEPFQQIAHAQSGFALTEVDLRGVDGAALGA